MYLPLFEPYKKMPDALLIEKIINGDGMAFAYLLVDHCGPRLKFLVRKSCYSELNFTLAELVNDIVIILKRNDFRDLRQFRGLDGATPCSLKTYISVIANRFLSRKLRKFLQEKQSFGTQVPLCEAIVPQKSDTTRTDILDDFDHLLSPREIAVLRLYKLEKRSVEEVAEILNITVANVYSICSRAIGRLRKILREEGYHD